MRSRLWERSNFNKSTIGSDIFIAWYTPEFLLGFVHSSGLLKIWNSSPSASASSKELRLTDNNWMVLCVILRFKRLLRRLRSNNFLSQSFCFENWLVSSVTITPSPVISSGCKLSLMTVFLSSIISQPSDVLTLWGSGLIPLNRALLISTKSTKSSSFTNL